VGQITNPIVKGITVLPVDRESGPGAGAGATGNNSILLGLSAGQNSSVRVIVIGSQSGDAGIADATLLPGTIILGAFSGQALLTHNAGTTNSPGADLIIGDSSFQSVTSMDSTIAIGQKIYPAATGTGFTGNVLIGNGIGGSAAGAFSISQSVVIGHGAMPGTPSNSAQDVIIGYEALANSTIPVGSNVFIGALVGPTAGKPTSGGSLQQNVVIGAGADTQDNGTGNVVVGYLATALQSTGGSGGGNVVLGASAAGAATTDPNGGNIVLGSTAQIPLSTAAGRNVIIGFGAGKAFVGTTPTISNVLAIETNAGTQKALLFGQFTTGNLILGNSISGTSQDFGGTTSTNIVKIINGTIGNANPVGGGYFYVNAGTLHWVDTGGNDTQLSNPTTGQIGASFVNLTNNAAANAGTLTNAPAIGNPTKWAPFNDNGTIRNIPMW
jgi:hypothetical protein